MLRLESLGFPTKKHEEWRYTPLRPLLQTAFVPTQTPHLPDVASLDAHLLPTTDTLRIVIAEGHLHADLSTLKELPQGLRIRSTASALQEATEENPLRKQLALALDQSSDHAFAALNLALFTDGVVIEAQKDAVITKPIEIVYLARHAEQPILSNTRSFVFAARHSQLTVIERFLSLDSATAPKEGSHPLQPYFTNAATSFVVEEGAHVDHYKLQEDARDAYSFALTWVHQKSNARFRDIALSFGALLGRNEIEAHLDGQGIETTLDGLYLVDGDRFIDNRTFLDHAKPHCNSFEVYKGILADQGKGTFNGKILVRQDAQKTDAKQSNQALLLSDNATLFSKPQLEIYADDVKCTHGATTGYLNPASLFYARARGIPEKEARGLLTYAFANEILQGIHIPALRDALTLQLAQHFQINPALDIDDWDRYHALETHE
jgi:Fe-S cluster assembly protein SufD